MVIKILCSSTGLHTLFQINLCLEFVRKLPCCDNRYCIDGSHGITSCRTKPLCTDVFWWIKIFLPSLLWFFLQKQEDYSLFNNDTVLNYGCYRFLTLVLWVERLASIQFHRCGWKTDPSWNKLTERNCKHIYYGTTYSCNNLLLYVHEENFELVYK